ncbi:BLUF domain-containing protein [Jiella sonneratiae]|uniref:BLUF domain-containing protein n=1 Tax=Jiella sonneratiae TaxID=2816856 RepID=A0ABS3J0I9_9HYPH|nr:BLUF domain-containing protein [Jiella sonneratiae]MBO0903195.1 BLUF domain-containing protein [Jiella sonneratiae]
MTSTPTPAPSVQRVLYRSKAKRIGGAPLAPRDVAAIVDTSVRNNRSCGLSGILLKVDDTFIQLVEGEQRAIEATFERICVDERHSDLVLIDMITAETRLFPEWSMAHVGSDADPMRLQVNRDLKEISFTVETHPEAALKQMRALLR